MTESLVIFTNCPDTASAEAIAHAVVSRRLAACASVQAACRSFFHWQDKLEIANEVPLIIKTTRAAFPALQAAITELHPYEVPEIIALPIEQGLPAYLNWLLTETKS